MQVDQREDLLEVAARLRRERDEAIALLRELGPTRKLEPSPGLQELVDTQQEFRERVMAKLHAALYG